MAVMQATVTFPTSTPPEPTVFQWYKVKHDKELFYSGNVDNVTRWDWRLFDPEVQLMYPLHKVEMYPAMQIMMWKLIKRGAPGLGEDLSKKRYRVIYQDDVTFCNRTGYEHLFGVQRSDYVNMRDLSLSLPALDKPRLLGGALVRGQVSGDNLLIHNYIDANKPLPSIDQIIAERLYFDAVFVGKYEAIRYEQGDGEPIFVPIVANRPVSIPLYKLKKLPMGYDITTHNPYVYE